MPFLAVAAAGSQVAKKVGVKVSFKTPSEKRARKVIPALVAAANNGNMAAVAVIDLRRGSGISKERAEWVKAYGQISQAVLARYLPQRAQHIAAIPPSGNITGGTIEGGASYALGQHIAEDVGAAAQLLDPLGAVVTSGTATDQDVKDALAATVERAAIGAGAAGAFALRGAPGPLDTLISVAKKPAVTVALIAGGVLVLVLVTASIARRR